MEVIGVDGYRRGWVAVRFVEAKMAGGQTFPQFSALLRTFEEARVIAVDIPVGLPENGQRPADVTARKVLGPRLNSVFFAPPRRVLEAPTFQTAVEAARSLGASVSQQMYALRRKVLEVNDLAATDSRVVEVHPEVSFWALNGNRPLRHSKRTWNGLTERIALLRTVGLTLPDEVRPLGDVPPDDLLDAVAAAWTALRVVEGQARTLPESPLADDRGRLAAIWY